MSCINRRLKNYNFVFNSSGFNCYCLAICHKDSVTILDHEKHCGVSLLPICIESLPGKLLRIALIYRTNTSSILIFCYRLEQVVKSENIDFVMGDFNINSLDHEMTLNLDHALCGYELVVNDATHLNGPIIDHIYINKIIKHLWRSYALLKVGTTLITSL